jgi:FKBP-type peptidyl-prolyl cis-trans isomerase
MRSLPRLASLAALAALLSACGGGQQPPAAAAPRVDPAVAQATKAYLDEIAHEPGVITTRSGLEYRVIQSGLATGHSPHADDQVQVNYEARLPSGELVDSSSSSGGPATFQVGAVIKAWTEALQLMKPGDVWMLYAPPNLAYGDKGAGPVPPGSALVFKVELVAIVQGAG